MTNGCVSQSSSQMSERRPKAIPERFARKLLKTCCGPCSQAKSSSSITEARMKKLILTACLAVPLIAALPKPQIFSLAYSADGKYLAMGGFREVRIKAGDDTF